MDEQGLWELFCKTGLPEAWLALSALRREEERELPAKTAFRPDIREV